MSVDHETVYAIEGLFEATYWADADRYYLYYGTRRIGQINSGKTPEEVYGSVKGWIKFVVKRSQKRIAKINEQLNDLYTEKSGLDRLILSAEKLGVDTNC